MTTAYCDAATFSANAAIYGAAIPVGMGTPQLTALLGIASSVIDRAQRRTYQPDPLSETHTWDAARRRFYPFNPPVASLTSITLRRAVNLTVTVDVTKCEINNSDGFVEINDPAISYGFYTTPGVLLFRQAVLEVVYVSYAGVPQDVKDACGYVAADLLSQATLNMSLPAGVDQINIGDILLHRSAQLANTGYMLPNLARLLLGPKRVAFA